MFTAIFFVHFFAVTAQGRSLDFSKGGSQRLLTRLYMVYNAALPRVSEDSVVLSQHEGPY